MFIGHLDIFFNEVPVYIFCSFCYWDVFLFTSRDSLRIVNESLVEHVLQTNTISHFDLPLHFFERYLLINRNS